MSLAGEYFMPDISYADVFSEYFFHTYISYKIENKNSHTHRICNGLLHDFIKCYF